MNTSIRSTLSLVVSLGLAAACVGDPPSADEGNSTTSASAGETDAGDGDTGDGDGDGDPGDGDGDGDEDLQRWEIRMPDFSPPSLFPTYYSCYTQTIEVPSDVHIVGFEPKVTDNHVHHYVVQMLDVPTTDDPADLCVEDPWDDMIWGWAPGGENLYLPAEAGFRAGQNGTVTVRFQVHYDNPLNQSFTDSGGFDVLYTENLRPNDAAIATFGDIGSIYIPAGEAAHEHVASCPSNFTAANFGGPLNVIATWLHAHDIGSVLWGEVVPAGGGAPYELGREDPYYFDNQTFSLVPANTVLMPGDEVRTHCVYDNSDGVNPVEGGPETADEMCINFVLYYPKSESFNECGLL
ncbi:monooxygenase [Enhygromyxa salina]|uniref:Copper type II ascorbate-dependent monooxygenase C-terminal domain-containing protein n=1 Tax=Enhygromyxa salina TaxID=215803 RepID=A0A2S9YVM1_9BACT|nr:hypothetical protein [Enhygromyxa salina]PRQ09124.1 hypothetical protein ENSA7_11140 [Enhygromyxa salina]